MRTRAISNLPISNNRFLRQEIFYTICIRWRFRRRLRHETARLDLVGEYAKIPCKQSTLAGGLDLRIRRFQVQLLVGAPLNQRLTQIRFPPKSDLCCGLCCASKNTIFIWAAIRFEFIPFTILRQDGRANVDWRWPRTFPLNRASSKDAQ